MTLAKTIAIGAAMFGFAAGNALAGERGFSMNGNVTVLEPVEVAYYDVYGIDENRDGVIDSYLLLPQSDTLG